MTSLSQMFSNVIRKGLALFSWCLPSLTDLIIPALMLNTLSQSSMNWDLSPNLSDDSAKLYTNTLAFSCFLSASSTVIEFADMATGSVDVGGLVFDILVNDSEVVWIWLCKLVFWDWRASIFVYNNFGNNTIRLVCSVWRDLMEGTSSPLAVLLRYFSYDRLHIDLACSSMLDCLLGRSAESIVHTVYLLDLHMMHAPRSDQRHTILPYFQLHTSHYSGHIHQFSYFAV